MASLVSVRCPHCNNSMKVKSHMARKVCPFCGRSFAIKLDV